MVIMASSLIRMIHKIRSPATLLVPKNVNAPHSFKKVSVHSISRQKAIPPSGYFLLIIPGAAFCLGSWQVKRRAWKLDIIKNLKNKINEPVIDLPLNPEEITSELEYRRVSIKGKFDHSREIILGPRPVLHDGQHKETGSLLSSGSSGYLIITPFVLSNSGKTILVNRGWVEKSKRNPSKRLDGQVTEEQEITGIVRLEEKRNPFMPKAGTNEKVFLYRDIFTMSSVADSLPIYVDAVESVPGGPFGGQTRISIRNEHLSYVVTWYSLSLLTACLWYRRYINPKAFL